MQCDLTRHKHIPKNRRTEKKKTSDSPLNFFRESFLLVQTFFFSEVTDHPFSAGFSTSKTTIWLRCVLDTLFLLFSDFDPLSVFNEVASCHFLSLLSSPPSLQIPLFPKQLRANRLFALWIILHDNTPPSPCLSLSFSLSLSFKHKVVPHSKVVMKWVQSRQLVWMCFIQE